MNAVCKRPMAKFRMRKSGRANFSWELLCEQCVCGDGRKLRKKTKHQYYNSQSTR